MSGCMPEPVNRVVGSSLGTRLARVMWEWPRAWKNSRYDRRISDALTRPGYLQP